MTIAGVFIFVVSFIVNLLDGLYLLALTNICLAALFVLMLGGAEERGGVLYVLFWIFMALAVLASLASLFFWGQEFFNL